MASLPAPSLWGLFKPPSKEQVLKFFGVGESLPHGIQKQG